jgi:uncharacterized protein
MFWKREKHMPDADPPAASSPCIGVCRMAEGLCVGCHRTLAEIVAWGMLSEAERLRIMREVLPLRDRDLTTPR